MSETVVVVGATSGVGLATAQLLVSEGYQVVISGRSQATVDHALRCGRWRTITLNVDVKERSL